MDVEVDQYVFFGFVVASVCCHTIVEGKGIHMDNKLWMI